MNDIYETSCSNFYAGDEDTDTDIDVSEDDPYDDAYTEPALTR